MTILLILFSLSVSLLFFLLLYGLFKRKVEPKDQIRQRIRNIRTMEQAGGTSTPWADQVMAGTRRAPRKKADIPFKDRVIEPARAWANRKLHQLAPREIYQWLEGEIAAAGKTGAWTPDNFMLVVAVMPILLGGMMFLAVMSSSYELIQKMTFCLLGAVIGAVLPFSTLNRTIRARQEQIRRELPETFDLLCVSVEAGLSFDAAIKKISSRMKGPFNDECRHMLNDVSMGMTRREAMKAMAVRCRVQEVSLFVTSIIQSEKLGTNMANTLRIQADNVRERHRQWVKAMALKAPVKIVLPLVGCILPAIFIVALGPAVMNIAKSFLGR